MVLFSSKVLSSIEKGRIMRWNNLVKRIDFHLHTISEKTKDSGFVFSQHWLDEYIKKTNLSAIAVTNHNLFDRNQFEEIKEKTNIIVFPGIELSLLTGHVNIVFDSTEEVISELDNINDKLVGRDLGRSDGISIEEFKTLFSKLDNGVIIFETGKSNSLSITSEFEDAYFKKFTLVQGVNSQLKFLRCVQQHSKYCPALFSDGHATDNDPDQARNDISKLSLKNTFIQTEEVTFSRIKDELSQIEHLGINPDLLPASFQVNVDSNHVIVSTGLNLIVGRRGSGKTYLLSNIKEQYGSDEVFYIKQFASSDETRDYLSKESDARENDAFAAWQNKYTIQLQAIVDHYQTPIEDTISDYLKKLQEYAHQMTDAGQANKIKLFREPKFQTLKGNRLEKSKRQIMDTFS